MGNRTFFIPGPFVLPVSPLFAATRSSFVRVFAYLFCFFKRNNFSSLSPFCFETIDSQMLNLDDERCEFLLLRGSRAQETKKQNNQHHWPRIANLYPFTWQRSAHFGLTFVGPVH